MSKRKGIILGVLCFTLLFMGIGFALFSTTLNLSGTATSSGTFDVKITDVELDSTKTSTGVTNNTATPGNNYAVTTQNLSAEFTEPGQYITWTLTVTNRGTIGATFTVETKPQVDTNSPYKLSCNATEGTVLAPSQSTTFQCEISFDKEKNLNSSQFAALEKGVDVTMEVSVRAVQSSGYVVPPASNILVGKTFSMEWMDHNGYSSTTFIKDITASTLKFQDFNSGEFMTLPYTYDSTNHILTVNNGEAIVDVIELQDNIILNVPTENDIIVQLTSNSNVGTSFMTGYSFIYDESNMIFFERSGLGMLGKENDENEAMIYYLVDTTNGLNGEATLMSFFGVYTVTKENGVYTSMTDGTYTYTLVPPTP